MTAADPATLDDYNRLTETNTQITGRGADVVTHLTCPGCAGPDWLGFPITAGLNDYADIQQPTQCRHCDRTFQVVIKGVGTGSMTFSFQQLAGEDPPAYLPPFPRVGEAAP